LRQVKQRRTQYRAAEALDRHREYGWDAPSTDLDCVEYDHGQPVAIVEYKHYRASKVDLQHPTCRANRALADAAGIPFLLVRYWPCRWTYYVQAANDIAAEEIPPEGELDSEWYYVDLLYYLRDRCMPDDELDDLYKEVDEKAIRWAEKHTQLYT